MAAQNVGIIYSTSQQVIRRTIDPRWLGYDRTGKTTNDPYFRVPDPNANDDLLIPYQAGMTAGESWALVPCATYDTHTSALQTHQYLNLTGIPGVTDRCIITDGSTVLAVVLGDPAIDSPQPTSPLKTTLGIGVGTPAPTLSLLADTTGQAYVGLPVVDGVAQIPPEPQPESYPDSYPDSAPENFSESVAQ